MLKKWIQKAIVQKTISYLPYKHKINYFFQKYVTKGVYLSDDYFYDRLLHAKEHIVAYQTNSNKPLTSSLEIGTGWYPVVPISLFLIGIKKIYSVDIAFLTSKERIKITIEHFIKAHQAGVLTNYLEVQTHLFHQLEELNKNYDQLTLDEILNILNITYLIEDARKLSLDNDSIDLVNSNNTFEHIYPSLLIPILAEFKRVVNKESGVMSHFIDMTDHFAHFDSSITVYNYLTFSNQQWSLIDNNIQPQNRLRIYEYKKIYSDLDIPISTETYRAGNVEQLKKIKLHKNYTNFPLEETAKTHCHFISKMSPSADGVR